ncbi:MAG: hypothetical protein ACM3SR_05505 [Ignavibacteriales bacterium]
MKPFYILLITLFTIAASHLDASPPGCKLESNLVESTIAQKVNELDGHEYCQFRHYDTLDDSDRDGTEDFIVLFTIEGAGGEGNNHIDFLSVFLSSHHWKPITVQTGERGVRDPIEINVEDGKIVLKTLEYLPSDPQCCPSGKGKLVYEIRNGKLRLLTK